MSLLSNLLLKQIKTATEDNAKTTKLATVSSVSGGKCYVTFYGESTPSQKAQKYVGSYSPSAGDTVLMQKVGNSYVITGKVV